MEGALMTLPIPLKPALGQLCSLYHSVVMRLKKKKKLGRKIPCNGYDSYESDVLKITDHQPRRDFA